MAAAVRPSQTTICMCGSARSLDRRIHADILQDKWSPIYNVNSILTSVQSLLTDPNPHSPANPEAAHMYESDIKEYQRRVRRVAEGSLEGDWE
eukprot:EC795093.1.p2 GENE.EC795093.1~~EC795093.1.p2  ORF type:complete len:93 (+),score=12.42 EC795093.1:146-424(+)